MHHVPDALSRMSENERVEKLSVLEPIEDEWYSRRREDVISSPNKYHGWKVVDDRLYKYRSNPLLEGFNGRLKRLEIGGTRYPRTTASKY